jgi:hypothetical protein
MTGEVFAVAPSDVLSGLGRQDAPVLQLAAPVETQHSPRGRPEHAGATRCERQDEDEHAEDTAGETGSAGVTASETANRGWLHEATSSS